MKKNFNVFIIIVFCSVVSFFMGTATSDQAISEHNVPAMVCAAMDFTGSYSQMEAGFGSFMQAFFQQGLQPAGPAMGIYYNSPQETEEKDLKWAIAFPVSSDTVIKSPLKKIELPASKAITAVHTGPYQNLGKTHSRIMEHVKKNGLKISWPLYEQYLNNPMQVKPEELKTEIFYPVEK